MMQLKEYNDRSTQQQIQRYRFIGANAMPLISSSSTYLFSYVTGTTTTKKTTIMDISFLRAISSHEFRSPPYPELQLTTTLLPFRVKNCRFSKHANKVLASAAFAHAKNPTAFMRMLRNNWVFLPAHSHDLAVQKQDSSVIANEKRQLLEKR